jgi:DNA repair protein RadC
VDAPVHEDADVERRSVAELLAMVVGKPEGGADLLVTVGGLERLSRADALEIAGHLGPAGRRAPRRAARALAAAFELGRRVEIARGERRAKLRSPADVAAWATPRLTALAHEELWMLGLDGRGYLRGARCVAKGGLHGAAVRAADPLRSALRVEACAFLLVHNHPSGDPTPSKEDIALTAQVARAAHVVGVALLDHVVVARDGFACVPALDRINHEDARDGNAR